jgi:hypothetical protein
MSTLLVSVFANRLESSVSRAPEIEKIQFNFDSLLGSYSVQKIYAKTSDGEIQVTFPGLVQTREITLDTNDSLVLKQKTQLEGCTKEVTWSLAVTGESGAYSLSKPIFEKCFGTCPTKATGYFQGYQVQDSSLNLSCGLSSDKIEIGIIRIENNRLVFEAAEEDGLNSLFVRN